MGTGQVKFIKIGALLGLWVLSPQIALSAGLQSVCDLGNKDATTVENSDFRILFKPDPNPIAVSVPFSLHLIICDKEGQPYDGKVNVDATMPMHMHGMYGTPKVVKHSPGSYQANGMMFQMPGMWQYKFQLKQDGKKHEILFDQQIK